MVTWIQADWCNSGDGSRGKGVGSSFLGTSRVAAEKQRLENLKVNFLISAQGECVAMHPVYDAVRAICV